MTASRTCKFPSVEELQIANRDHRHTFRVLCFKSERPRPMPFSLLRCRPSEIGSARVEKEEVRIVAVEPTFPTGPPECLPIA